MENRFSDILNAMRGKRILILGDMIADVYLTGQISRISRLFLPAHPLGGEDDA